MNTKQRVDKRYVPPTVVHTSKWERVGVVKVGRRVLRPGQVVKIQGQRAAEFTFMYAERNRETGAVNLTFVGGKHGHRTTRTFTPDKVGRFLYMSELGARREGGEDA